MVSGLEGSVGLFAGRAVLTGSFSGFDTGKLVESLVNIKRIPADRLEARIELNDIKREAYQQLSGLLSQLSSSLDGLRNPPGSAGSESNVFLQKAVFLQSSSTTTANSLMGVSAASSAALGTYDVEVLQLATAQKVSGGALADATLARGQTGIVTLGLAGGQTATVEVSADMSAADIARAINAKRSTTGVSAMLLKVGEGDYRVVLTADQTNRAIEISDDQGGAILADLGLSNDNGASFANELRGYQPSQIRIDGLADVIERDGNEVTDAIEGLTLDLYRAEPGTTITVEIDNDRGVIKDAILSFVESYNALRDFIASQQSLNTKGDGAAEEAILFGEQTLRSIASQLGSDLAGRVAGLPAGALDTLRSLGVELDASNRLTVKEAQLDEALVSRLDEVRGLFEYGFESDSQSLRVLARSRKLEVGDFELSVTTDATGAITGASVTGQGDVFEISGSRLIGKAGTAFEGMTLAYVASAPGGTEAIQVSTRLGLAERLYQSVERFAAPEEGEIARQIAALGEQSDSWAKQVARIDERLADYQQKLLEKFARLEQAIAQADALTKQLKAMLRDPNDD